MMTQEEINKIKDSGVLVITQNTFKKSTTYNTNGTVNYKDRQYKYTWLLTYLHRQYYRLDEVSL